jgi:hypothetical protein
MYLLLHVVEEEGRGGREEARAADAGCCIPESHRELLRSAA